MFNKSFALHYQFILLCFELNKLDNDKIFFEIQ